MSRKLSAKTTSLSDQVVALLDEHGPLTTTEIAKRMPPRVYVTCGHDDCTRPEHRRTYLLSMYQGDAYSLLAGMHKRKQIERTPFDSSSPTMWWVKDGHLLESIKSEPRASE